MVIINTVFILLSEVLNSNVYIIWLFTYLAIYSDYFFSQRKNYFVNLDGLLCVIVGLVQKLLNLFIPMILSKITLSIV